MRKGFRFCSVAIGALLWGIIGLLSAVAQTQNAQVTGTIYDQAGAVVPRRHR